MFTLIATATILSCQEGWVIISRINKHPMYTPSDKIALVKVVKQNMPKDCKRYLNER